MIASRAKLLAVGENVLLAEELLEGFVAGDPALFESRSITPTPYSA
jgi:hypothetical protein